MPRKATASSTLLRATPYSRRVCRTGLSEEVSRRVASMSRRMLRNEAGSAGSRRGFSRNVYSVAAPWRTRTATLQPAFARTRSRGFHESPSVHSGGRVLRSARAASTACASRGGQKRAVHRARRAWCGMRPEMLRARASRTAGGAPFRPAFAKPPSRGSRGGLAACKCGPRNAGSG